MKILLTGASGLVGSAFAVAAALRGHEVVGVTGRFHGPLPGLAQQQALDLADDEAVMSTVPGLHPDVIVNCAAVSEPAACEADPVASGKLNVVLPGTLANLAVRLGARLVQVSSEQVFDGTRTQPYAPGDPTSPINLYGRQKLAGEQAVLAAASEAAVVRAPLLMGNSPGGRRSLHERLFADWAAGRIARLYTDEFRQPCTAENLAQVLLELAERRDLRGVFHWAGTDVLSRFEIGRRLRAHFQLTENNAPIAPVTRAETPRVAASRQPYLALDLAPLATALRTRPQALAEQLASLHVPPPCRAWYRSA